MTTPKNKVLFLSAWYPNRRDDMLGLFVKRHAQAVANYYNVCVLYIHSDNILKNNIYEIEEKKIEKDYEIIVYYRPASSGYSLFKPFINSFRYLKSFYLGWKRVKEYFGTPDIIQVNILTRAAVPAFFFKMFYNIPYIIVEHWSRYLPNVNTYKGLLRKIFTKIVVAKANALLVVSENLRKAMKLHHLENKNTFIINNVVDTDIFRPLPAVKENGAYQLIHISCFEDKSKNISGLLRAIKELTYIRNDFILHLVGEGQDKKKLESLAKELEINDKYVFFDGIMRDVDVANALGKSHLLLLFSNYENIPVVINEALSCGKPVVATRVGGISEMLSPDCGVLVEAGNEKNFAKAIDNVLNNLNNYYPVNLRKKIVDKYSMQIVGKQLAELYDNIINKSI